MCYIFLVCFLSETYKEKTGSGASGHAPAAPLVWRQAGLGLENAAEVILAAVADGFGDLPDRQRKRLVV